MKNILDSIIQVEQKLQKNVMDAQKEADSLLTKSKTKLDLLEQEYAKEFNEKRKAEIAAIEKEAEDYSARLMKDMHKITDAQVKKLKEKHQAISEGIRKLFIEHSQD